MDEIIIKQFRAAYSNQRGNDLSYTLLPEAADNADKSWLSRVWEGTDARAIAAALKSVNGRHLKMSKTELEGWTNVYIAYWKALGEISAVEGHRGHQSSWVKVYEAWKELTSAIIRGYTNHDFENWTIPCLYVAGRYMRVFAIRADAEGDGAAGGHDLATTFQEDDLDPELAKRKYLEDCARQLNRIFNTCLSDRAPLSESRKWGIYYAINLLFKTYFRINSAALSKNVLASLTAGRGDMPDFDSFPKSQQVTFKYYEGVLCFLEENYEDAERHLTMAWLLCHKDATRNLELILTYLIPCHLLTTHTLPSAKLLKPFPRLQALFLNLAQTIKKGDLDGFSRALEEGEEEFMKRRIYLTLERGRDIALRNLLRTVYLNVDTSQLKEGEAPVPRTRIRIDEFAAAIRISGKQDVDHDEVECLLANMIYKDLMRGYISRDHGMVVLSKSGAFPGTGV